MKIVWFPLFASITLIIFGGLFLGWPGFGRLLAGHIGQLPVKLIGIFWFFMAVGVWFSSVFIFNSWYVYLVAILMAVDSATLIFINLDRLAANLSWFNQARLRYRILYSLSVVIIGGILMMVAIGILN